MPVSPLWLPNGFTPRRFDTTCGCRVLRIADMWLRPRTELFPSDPRWWEFNDDRAGWPSAWDLGS